MKTLGNASRVYPPRTIGNGPSMNLPYTDLANIFTAAQRISLATSGTIAELFGTENSATANVIDHYRTRSGGAGVAGDDLFEQQFNGNDSASAKTKYARTLSEIVDPTNGSEDGRYSLGTMRAGTVVDWRVESGAIYYESLTVPSAAGTINAVAYQVNNASTIYLLQRTYDVVTGPTSTAANIPADNTVPQNTEGTQIFSRSFTPKSATSTIVIDVLLQGAFNGAGVEMIMALFKDSGASAIAAASSEAPSNGINTLHLHFEETSGSTTARTYAMRYGANSGTMLVNQGNAFDLGNIIQSSMTIQEVQG